MVKSVFAIEFLCGGLQRFFYIKVKSSSLSPLFFSFFLFFFFSFFLCGRWPKRHGLHVTDYLFLMFFRCFLFRKIFMVFFRLWDIQMLPNKEVQKVSWAVCSNWAIWTRVFFVSFFCCHFSLFPDSFFSKNLGWCVSACQSFRYYQT